MENQDIVPGTHFKYKNIEWSCLDREGNTYFLIAAEPVAIRTFSGNNYKNTTNDWKDSDLRKWLNEEFIKTFDDGDLVPMKQSLRADNGDWFYGECEDYVSLLTCDQYRDYREFVPDPNDYFWLVTPSSCDYPNYFHVKVSLGGELSTCVTLNKCMVLPVIKLIIED